MLDNRGLQLEIVKDAAGESRVGVYIYADDDNVPVIQAYAIPITRVRVVTKAEVGSPYCIDNWSLEELIRSNQ